MCRWGGGGGVIWGCGVGCAHAEQPVPMPSRKGMCGMMGCEGGVCGLTYGLLRRSDKEGRPSLNAFGVRMESMILPYGGRGCG